MDRMHTLSVQAVLFDLDGTLLDSFEHYSQSLTAALSELGYGVPSRERMRQLMGWPARETLISLGVPPERAEEVDRLWTAWEEKMPHLARPVPGIVPLLERLRASGLRVGLVTSRPRMSVDVTPAAMQLLPLMNVQVMRDDTPEGKPDPAPVLEALRRLGLPADESVYVGDARYDVEAGRRAGAWTVLATWAGGGLPPSPEFPPHYTVASLHELAALLLDSPRGPNLGQRGVTCTANTWTE
jgi:pyrophosphatase PpaX